MGCWEPSKAKGNTILEEEGGGLESGEGSKGVVEEEEEEDWFVSWRSGLRIFLRGLLYEMEASSKTGFH